MARQGSVSFGASRRPLYDAVVGALFVLICAASVYLPILLLPGAIVLCALLRGGRTTYPALLFALGFAAIVLVCGSFLFAILALVFLLFAVLPIALFQKKLATRAHFDGVLVQCAGVALGIAAVYGVLYLLLGAEPIHTICAAFESALMQDESESATELLRLSWELKQSMYLMNGETSPTAGALMQVLNSAAALSREELAAQTAGFAESLARSVLPTVCVLLSSVGALICYVLPSLWLSRPDRGIGKFLSLDPRGARPLPPFAGWQLPRDIGAGLFGAVILFLIASFAGWEAADRIMLLLYTLFTAVFYVQGVSCVYFLLGRTKLPRGGAIALTIAAGVVGATVVFMIGALDYVIRLRGFIEFSAALKQNMRSQTPIDPNAWPKSGAPDAGESDDSDKNAKAQDDSKPQTPESDRETSRGDSSDNADDPANKED